MKICAVVPGFSRSSDDASIPALRELLLGWAAAGDEVEVLALRHPPGPATYTLGPLRVRTLGGGTSRGLARAALLWRALDALAQMPNGRPDVLVGFWADEPGWVVAQAGARLQIPTLVALMGGELAALGAIGYGVGNERLGRQLRDHALAHADAVSVGSAWLAERLLQPGAPAMRRERPRVLPLGVDLRRFGDAPGHGAAEALAAAPRLRLGVLGNLVPVKNHAALMRTVARLRGEGLDVRLDIAGDGPERSALRALAATLGVADAVQLRGALAWTEVAAWLRGLDVHVLPSRWESQGMVTLEAAACGVAVAGSAVGSLATFAACAARWPAHDDAAMTRALRQLALRHRDDPAWLALRGAQARAEVERTASLDVAVAAWREALAATIAGRVGAATGHDAARSRTIGARGGRDD